MTLLAYGVKQVRALEYTLGGKPPKKAADQALAALKQQMSERYERRNAQIAKMRPLMERSRAPLLELIKKDKAAVAALEKRRTLTLARGKEKLRIKHERLKIDPRMVSGSGFWLKAPPYDVPFSGANGAASASSNINAGTYGLSMTGNGSSAAASAGVQRANRGSGSTCPLTALSSRSDRSDRTAQDAPNASFEITPLNRRVG